MKIIATFDIPDAELEAKIPEFNENADEMGYDPFETAEDLADYLCEQLDEGNIDVGDIHDDYGVVVEWRTEATL